MRFKKLAPVVLSLCCATASAQEAREKEVYISVGSETLDALRTSFRASGTSAPTLVREANGVSVLKLNESQLGNVSQLMHDKYHRCAGFLTHDTQEAALAVLQPVQPAINPSLVSYTLDNAAVVSSLFSGLQESSLRSTITQLSSYTNRYYKGSASSVQASNWLRDTWLSYAAGRSDVSVQLYTHSTWDQPSVIATITGTLLPSEVVVIGGHLDSINLNVASSSRPTATAPGADDDASGVATLSEVFRVAMAKGYKPARTVKFMAYAAEEVGLLGSQAIAQAHKAAATNVVGVLQLDMTNYRGSTVEVTLVTDNTNAAQNTFLGNLIDTYTGYSRSNITCGYGCSDHASWTSAGYPASIPFEATMSQDNPYIHTANDTLANSTDGQSGNNANNALKFARIAAAYLAELGKGTIPGLPTDTQAPTVTLTTPTNGGTVTGTVNLAATASDNVGVNKVEFFVDGAIRGTSFTSPYTFAWDSRTVANGSHTFAAKASDSAGNATTTSTTTATVSNVSTSGTYDATYKTLRCSAVAATCDSGTAFKGRGAMSPAETSAPNTLKGTCIDGSSGTFHSDESNDALKVSTVDGSNFAPGKQVKVEATVWAYASPSSDRLDLYYTANAAATTPVWTLITTITPTAAGATTLSATYTLPSGTNQAVRAQFRYGSGSPASACVSNEYNDRDDLVFTVGQ
ncbi:M20/M25/M40 family metallo-hydrolase [Corallococcus terminator]|uniref:M20/M25/M40 family metallo-hydrolase n=1 Tax=Corallococcus terminator TaxID=2316733 RepID=A0A3A8ISM4_9BACT|nr:M20/M25/M40 family metallo-hydrolase [Corallococcus terminator]RKG85688.1 M20/M25/M40 family metallo-hydrolase [Corallococcus terminator]